MRGKFGCNSAHRALVDTRIEGVCSLVSVVPRTSACVATQGCGPCQDPLETCPKLVVAPMSQETPVVTSGSGHTHAFSALAIGRWRACHGWSAAALQQKNRILHIKFIVLLIWALRHRYPNWSKSVCGIAKGACLFLYTFHVSSTLCVLFQFA